jgi:hypothetical protein
MKTKKIITLVIAILLIAPTVFAGKIFLNGMDITGVKNKSFKQVKEVKIDDKGDIHLTAPQYEVKVMETGDSKSGNPSAATSDTPVVSGQYFIATDGPGKKVQYQLSIAINGVERLVIPPKSSSTIEEISKWLVKGKNKVIVTAIKKIDNGRISTSSADVLKLMIGRGHEEKKVVKIDKLLATFSCDASKLTDFAKQYTINVE